MTQRDKYYSRVEKIVGTHLIHKNIAVFNAPSVSKTIELMVSCGTLGWNFMSKTKMPNDMLRVFGQIQKSDSFEDSFALYLQEENHFGSFANPSFSVKFGRISSEWRWATRVVIDEQSLDGLVAWRPVG